MRKVILFVIVVFAFSCKPDKKNNQATDLYNGKYPRTDRLFAVYLDTSGLKIPGIVLRQISKVIKYDSAAKIETIITDTLWGVQRIMYPKDTTKQPSLEWFVIGKDSVNTHVENISIDSLIKK